MTIAFMAYVFDSNVKNEGDRVKSGLFCIQGTHVVKCDVRQSHQTTGRKTHYDRPIVHNKGDAYLIDCNVTGSDEGASDKLEFSLLALLQASVFPKVDELVGSGGAYECYLPIFQEDNAGPHIHSAFFNFETSTCSEKGWYWEPQDLQMPHMNNLDLAVFPAMLKSYSTLLTRYSSKMAPAEEIWEAALSVWVNLGLSEIVRGFILAYHVTEKVIKEKGANCFLQ